jgi:hypothetical protein
LTYDYLPVVLKTQLEMTIRIALGGGLSDGGLELGEVFIGHFCSAT